MDRLDHGPVLRRALALALLAWLNLLVQPAFAAALPGAAGMDHCEHAGDCPEMRQAPCDATQDVTVDTARAPAVARPAALLGLPLEPAASAAGCHTRTCHPPITGPPLIIRFGHLRN